ncbi:MAG: DEAD/DEAH box helicase [Lachnospiraceae bacterium]|nr:DEAD/DEAH box helicase [Lachnospiraceae bacterium]
MELTDFYRSFTEDELVRGAEYYFADELKDLEIKKDKRSVAKPPVKISAKWPEHIYKKDGEETISYNKCSITIHPFAGLPCSCECKCEEFDNNLYGCSHTAALLVAYMVQEKGGDVFAGTFLEERLKDLANVEDPFVPGVLKKTDGRLLMLLDNTAEEALPTWPQKTIFTTAPASLEVECALTVSDRENLLLDLKVGARKKYVIKNIEEFLWYYRNELLYSLGKEMVHLCPSAFTTESRKILDYLVSLMDAKEKGLLSNRRLFSQGSGRAERYMIFSGRELDGLMDLLDGRTITFNEVTGCEIQLAKKGICGTLKKKAYGASLQINDLYCLCMTGAWMYMFDKSSIFRIAIDSTREIKELEKLFGWTEPLYVREADIGRVLNRLMPLFDNYGTLVTKGIETENYEKEKPAFEFRLDYTGEGLLTCEAFAVYSGQDIRCHLFDNQSDRNRRNVSAETVVDELLIELFDEMDAKSFLLYSELNESELFCFLCDNLPRLEAIGTVLSTDKLKRSRVRYLPKVSAVVKAERGNLLLSISSAGISDEEMASILGAYRKKKKYFRLKSGEFVSLETKEEKAWETLSELYENYGKKNPANIKIPMFRALYLKEALEKKEAVDFDPSEEYLELLKRMDPDSMKDQPVPKALEKVIRPYQIEGYRWIKLLKNCGFGGILADDMGLGKTLQVLSFLLSEKNKNKRKKKMPSLVVCPASLVYNWKREIETYTSELSVAIIAGTVEERSDKISRSLDKDIWVTSYDLLKRDISLYEGIHFANEIIDEAQYIKNHNTQASQSVRLVESDFRLALTGTPIENHLSELWSIMDYLMPGFLYDHSGFQQNYEIPIVAGNNPEIRERLRSMVHPFILRRMKKQVLKELPEKMEETIYIRLESEQKKLYQANAKKMRDELDHMSAAEFKTGKLQFLAQLMTLREICCDPALVYESYKGGSAKLEACLELIQQSIQSGHKLLLFSQFTSMLDIICKRLKEESIDFHRIDGSTGKEKRMQMVDSFANDDVPVFCISLKAGGTGLNLTAADIVIHYDPWWNRAAQDQATDRTHRIGQTHTVNVYELITEDTIEERIQKIKESKKQLAEDILSGGEISSASFNKDEMLRLLS